MAHHVTFRLSNGQLALMLAVATLPEDRAESQLSKAEQYEAWLKSRQER